MNRFAFISIVTLCVSISFLLGCHRRAASKPEQYSPERLRADYKADKLGRFEIRMVGPTKTGQLVTMHDLVSEKVCHIVGDIGLAQGDTYDGYFEFAGMYEYTAAGGGASRVRNYIWRGFAGDDIKADVEKEMEEYRTRSKR